MEKTKEGYNIKLIYKGKEYPVNFIKGNGTIRLEERLGGCSASASVSGGSVSVRSESINGESKAYINGVCVQDYIRSL